MNAQQLQRRQEIMERLWATEDSAPQADAPEVLAAAARAVAELEGLLEGVGGDDDPLEVGRTWRYLGDTYFTLSAKRDKDALARGRGSRGAAPPASPRASARARAPRAPRRLRAGAPTRAGP